MATATGARFGPHCVAVGRSEIRDSREAGRQAAKDALVHPEPKLVVYLQEFPTTWSNCLPGSMRSAMALHWSVARPMGKSLRSVHVTIPWW